VHAGREADYQEPGGRVAEWCYRLAVIVRVLFLDTVKKCGQARAVPAARVEHVSRLPTW